MDIYELTRHEPGINCHSQCYVTHHTGYSTNFFFSEQNNNFHYSSLYKDPCNVVHAFYLKATIMAQGRTLMSGGKTSNPSNTLKYST